MLVNGFIGAYDIENDKASFPLGLLFFFDRYRIKVSYRMKEKEPEFVANPVENLLSIFYAYAGIKKNVLKQALVTDINNFIKKSKLTEDSVIVISNVNDFTSINIDNQDKRIIRTITKPNFLSICSTYKFELEYHISKVNRLYLNHLYYNFKIIRDDFEYFAPNDWIAEVMESPGYLENSYWLDLVLILAKFYDDGYRRIRVIVPHAESKKIETFSDSYSSFYIQCGFIAKSKKIAIKGSYPNNSLRDYAVGAAHAYLSHFKNFDNMYKRGRDFTHIFKIGKKISIDDNFTKSNYLKYLRYRISIDMYNYHDSKSHLYNLFVLFFDDPQNIAFAIDENAEIFNINTIQIILPYNKGETYKLFENNIFYNKIHMKKIVEQIISNSLIIIRSRPRPTVFIIPKD